MLPIFTPWGNTAPTTGPQYRGIYLAVCPEPGRSPSARQGLQRGLPMGLRTPKSKREKPRFHLTSRLHTTREVSIPGEEPPHCPRTPQSLGPTAPLGVLDLNHGLASSLRGDTTNVHFLGSFQRIMLGIRIIKLNSTTDYLGRSHGHAWTRVGGEGRANE